MSPFPACRTDTHKTVRNLLPSISAPKTRRDCITGGPTFSASFVLPSTIVYSITLIQLCLNSSKHMKLNTASKCLHAVQLIALFIICLVPSRLDSTPLCTGPAIIDLRWATLRWWGPRFFWWRLWVRLRNGCGSCGYGKYWCSRGRLWCNLGHEWGIGDPDGQGDTDELADEWQCRN